jgi:hypothetical protein
VPTSNASFSHCTGCYRITGNGWHGHVYTFLKARSLSSSAAKMIAADLPVRALGRVKYGGTVIFPFSSVSQGGDRREGRHAVESYFAA